MLPRGLGNRHAYPAEASRTAFGSESEKKAPQFHVGPPCTQAISGSGPSTPGGVINRPWISMPSGAFHLIVLTSGNVTPVTMSSLKDVNRCHEALRWSNRASSGACPCAWCVVHTTVASSCVAHTGVVTSSPMNASPRQRSSRRPSSHIRPHAVPVPSHRAYQRESSSIHAAMPTVSRPGHGSDVVPSTRSTTITLPLSRPWSLA